MHSFKYFVRHHVQISVRINISENSKRLLQTIFFSSIFSLYRVIAYNDAGPSEPGEASEPVVIDVPGVQVGKILSFFWTFFFAKFDLFFWTDHLSFRSLPTLF